jgi:AbrB family looped-hinge helix DNA binding protein
MEMSIRVRQRGTLTLPAELREKHGIKPGDTFRLVDLDGIFAGAASPSEHSASTVVRPGKFVLHVRDLLTRLDVAGEKGEEG